LLSAAVLGPLEANEISYDPEEGHFGVVDSDVVVLAVHVESETSCHGDLRLSGKVWTSKGGRPRTLLEHFLRYVFKYHRELLKKVLEYIGSAQQPNGREGNSSIQMPVIFGGRSVPV
jgi:hypothetical protein